MSGPRTPQQTEETTLAKAECSRIDKFLAMNLSSKRRDLVLHDFNGDQSGKYIFSRFQNFVETTFIDASGCYFGKQSCVELARFLQSPQCQVEKIFAEWNQFGLDSLSLSLFGNAIGQNNTLIHLDLRNNNIGPEGGASLSKGIVQSPSLIYVDLRWNDLGDNGGNAFLRMIEENPHKQLSFLHLSGNEISQDISKKINAALKLNIPMRPGNFLEHNPMKLVNGAPQKITLNDVTLFENEGMKWRTSDLKEQLELERARVSSSVSTADQLRVQLQESYDSNLSIKQDLIQKNEEIDRLSEEINLLNEKLKKSEGDIVANQENFDKIHASVSTAKDNLKIQLTNMQIQLDGAQRETQSIRANATRQQQEYHSSLRDEVEKKQAVQLTLDDKLMEIASLTSQLQAAKDNEEWALKRLQESTRHLAAREEEMKHITNDIAEKSNLAIKAAEEDFKEKIALLHSRVKEAELKENQTKDALNRMSNEVELERAQAEERLASVRVQIQDDMTSEHQASIANFVARTQQLEEMRKALDFQLKAASEEIASLKNTHAIELQEVGKDISFLKDELERAHQDARKEGDINTRIKAEWGEAQRALEPTRCRAEEAEMKLEKCANLLDTERKERNEEEKRLERDLSANRKKIIDLEQVLVDLKSSHEKYVKELHEEIVQSIHSVFVRKTSDLR